MIYYVLVIIGWVFATPLIKYIILLFVDESIFLKLCYVCIIYFFIYAIIIIIGRTITEKSDLEEEIVLIKTIKIRELLYSNHYYELNYDKNNHLCKEIIFRKNNKESKDIITTSRNVYIKHVGNKDEPCIKEYEIKKIIPKNKRFWYLKTYVGDGYYEICCP